MNSKLPQAETTRIPYGVVPGASSSAAWSLRLDVAAVAVVVTDQDQLDRLRERPAIGHAAAVWEVQLLVRQPEDELGSFLGSATQQRRPPPWR